MATLEKLIVAPENSGEKLNSSSHILTPKPVPTPELESMDLSLPDFAVWREETTALDGVFTPMTGIDHNKDVSWNTISGSSFYCFRLLLVSNILYGFIGFTGFIVEI